MKLYIASDHRGTEIEQRLINVLHAEGLSLIHHATDDYPDFAFELCNKVLESKDNLGVLLCGTGIGMSIAANKVKGIRAARCVNKQEAILSKEHNAANVICLSTALSESELVGIINTFVNTPSATEEKHIRRVNKIINYESDAYNEL